MDPNQTNNVDQVLQELSPQQQPQPQPQQQAPPPQQAQAAPPPQPQQQQAQGVQQSPFNFDSWATRVQSGDRSAQAEFDQHFYGMPQGVTVGDAVRMLDQAYTRINQQVEDLTMKTDPRFQQNPQLGQRARDLVREGRAKNLSDAAVLAQAELGPAPQPQPQPQQPQQQAPQAPPQPWSPPQVGNGGVPSAGGADLDLGSVRAKTANLSTEELGELISKLQQTPS